MHAVTELIAFWSLYFAQCNLQQLMLTHTPITSGCGLVYELPNIVDRADESCALVDMRDIAWTEPHYHVETEIYFILQGNGRMVIAGCEQTIAAGDVVVVPSNKAHFVLPGNDLIIGVINTPPFNAENYIPLTATNSTVGFDRTQFDALTQQ
jgi:mannose-6-phosphate isomerase-like protein (cupin superfamily)